MDDSQVLAMATENTNTPKMNVSMVLAANGQSRAWGSDDPRDFIPLFKDANYSHVLMIQSPFFIADMESFELEELNHADALIDWIEAMSARDSISDFVQQSTTKFLTYQNGIQAHCL